MTRNEELSKLAHTITEEFANKWETDEEWQDYRDYVLEKLQQAEREVWARVIERIESVMEPEHESTDDQVWEFREWCKQQREGL